MRLSQGVLCGRRIELYHPEFFEEHEEVIIFTREEFRRMYQSMDTQINHIHRLDMGLDRGEEWNSMGVWPRIMECIHILTLNLESVFNNNAIQTYLDSYIYDGMNIGEKTGNNSLNEVLTPESLEFTWSK
ncbi:hypothetical protein BK007_00110 [Methanobacterium subterraneum]|uniref:Uncharacterized protein n=1 Tax=Methanobacterium subterraneum TaxID=59277 RepID=A0A2H4VMW7_9EURY|nr:hypothetical protein [Methanobacterium subterraneum]AUB54584.1 hypothetical protein BK007_00110 [Methanobacterium subterraneum]AUB59438.1 hypothetical protein BK009_01315 [Methanobacterium subterraneum]PKL73528.1 MAG: hypothetical protein CVV29_03065 [Methanobacteriales archaeon HGW-Methanobacteriales-2]